MATLRAAAPWQPFRRTNVSAVHDGSRWEWEAGARLAIRAQDLHVHKLKRPAETVTIFVVDASGSSALNRMSEAKGAVELLLGRCYARRDKVALISFRGTSAEIVLPPTHALARAKRLLGGFRGGGGTPLANGLDLARETAEGARRRGQQPTIILMTDGRANVCRNGNGDRVRATAEAEASAHAMRRSGLGLVVVDTSPQPRAEARHIAQCARGRYVPLPHAGSDRLAALVGIEGRCAG
jgi:magnesium chelatase subunit D